MSNPKHAHAGANGCAFDCAAATNSTGGNSATTCASGAKLSGCSFSVLEKHLTKLSSTQLFLAVVDAKKRRSALDNSNSIYGRNVKLSPPHSRKNPRRRATGAECSRRWEEPRFACMEMQRLRPRQTFHTTGPG